MALTIIVVIGSIMPLHLSGFVHQLCFFDNSYPGSAALLAAAERVGRPRSQAQALIDNWMALTGGLRPHASCLGALIPGALDGDAVHTHGSIMEHGGAFRS